MPANPFASLEPIQTTGSFPLTSSSTLLSLVHQPELLIRLNPLVESFNILPSSPSLPTSDPSSSPVTYTITDKIPILFGLWSTRTSYTARFTPKPDGMLVLVEAAMGVRTRSEWIVSSGAGGGATEVTEKSEVDIVGGSMFASVMRGFVEGQIKSSHGVLMERLREQVRQKDQEGQESTSKPWSE